jgi:hypothetical protein
MGRLATVLLCMDSRQLWHIFVLVACTFYLLAIVHALDFRSYAMNLSFWSGTASLCGLTTCDPTTA